MPIAILRFPHRSGIGFLRGLCLASLDPLLDHIADDTDFQLLEIDVRPLEAQQFSDPQSGQCTQQHRRLCRVHQVCQKTLQFIWM